MPNDNIDETEAIPIFALLHILSEVQTSQILSSFSCSGHLSLYNAHINSQSGYYPSKSRSSRIFSFFSSCLKTYNFSLYYKLYSLHFGNVNAQ